MEINLMKKVSEATWNRLSKKEEKAIWKLLFDVNKLITKHGKKLEELHWEIGLSCKVREITYEPTQQKVKGDE